MAVGYCSAAICSTHPHPDMMKRKPTANELIVRSISGFSSFFNPAASVSIDNGNEAGIPQSIITDAAESMNKANLPKSDLISDIGFVADRIGDGVQSVVKKFDNQLQNDKLQDFFFKNVFKNATLNEIGENKARLDMLEVLIDHPGTKHHIDGILDQPEPLQNMDADFIDIEEKSNGNNYVNDFVNGLYRSITAKKKTSSGSLSINEPQVIDDEHLKNIEDEQEKAPHENTISSITNRLLTTKRASDLLRISGISNVVGNTSNITPKHTKKNDSIVETLTRKKSKLPIDEEIYRTDSVKDSLFPPTLMKELHKTTHDWRRINLQFDMISSIWCPATHALAPGKEIPFLPEGVRMLARHS
ncbi:hypothetical protein HK096_000702, partial [Nowakowskiella sp. JEL0078]